MGHGNARARLRKRHRRPGLGFKLWRRLRQIEQTLNVDGLLHGACQRIELCLKVRDLIGTDKAKVAALKRKGRITRHATVDVHAALLLDHGSDRLAQGLGALVENHAAHVGILAKLSEA